MLVRLVLLLVAFVVGPEPQEVVPLGGGDGDIAAGEVLGVKLKPPARDGDSGYFLAAPGVAVPLKMDSVITGADLCPCS